MSRAAYAVAELRKAGLTDSETRRLLAFPKAGKSEELYEMIRAVRQQEKAG